MICDHCVLVCMFLERLWEGFCNILSGVGGSEWGLCSIVGRREGIINSSLNAPGRQSASPPPIEFTAPRSGDILGFFLNFLILIQQKLMDIRKFDIFPAYRLFCIVW